MEQNRKENLFVQMCRRHQKEFNEFPLVFAFSKEEALEKLGLTHEESDVVSCFSNTGSYFKKVMSRRFTLCWIGIKRNGRMPFNLISLATDLFSVCFPMCLKAKNSPIPTILRIH